MSNVTKRVEEFVSEYPRLEMTEDGPVDRWVKETYFQPFAQSDEGHRWVGGVWSEKADADQELAELGEPGKDAGWVEVDPVYGSAAWGSEDEFALAQFEADAFGEELRWR